MRRRVTGTLVGCAILIAAGAGRSPIAHESARLHTELKSSVPGRDTLIREVLQDVRLVFSGPVEAKLSSLRWVGPAGDTLLLRVAAVPDQPHILVAEAPPAANGAQDLLWRTVSIDGHQVSGTISFVAEIAELAQGVDTMSARASDVDDPGDAVGSLATGDREMGGDLEGIADGAGGVRSPSADSRPGGFPTSRVAVRGLGMFCLLGFAGLLWFGLGTTLLGEPRTHRLTSILGMGATVLLSLDLLLWLGELAAPGVSLAETFGVVVGTRSGVAEIGRTGLAAVAFLIFSGTRAERLGALLAMLAVVTGALGGHQAAIEPLVSLPANALHLGAAAVWVGGVLLLGVWPATRGDAARGDLAGAGWTFGRVAMRVSSAALLASGVILVTAIVQDFIYLPSLGALFSSTYGKLLLAKSAGFAALVAFGAYNRFRLIPMISDAELSGRPLRRSVRLELVVMIVVVLVAVALAQVPPPIE